MKKPDQENEEYELLPHKELMDLKEELRQLREFEITPTKKLEISVIELNKKLDKLIDIFERASQDMRVEEGGMSFREKMRPVIDKMNKVLEQNAEIASGILAVADLIRGPKQENKLPSFAPPGFEPPFLPQTAAPMQRLPPQEEFSPKQMMPPGRPPQFDSNQFKPNIPQGVNLRPAQPLGNLPPPPQKKRTFGL